jgi:hypothetical protein
MRQTGRRGEVETLLSLAGVTLGHRSLPIELTHPNHSRYRVPAEARLLVEQQIKWLVWDEAEPVGQAVPISPTGSAALPGFIRLADANDAALLSFARQRGPLGEGWRRAVFQ